MLATESATPMEISTAGEQALVILYNGTSGEQLDSLHYKHFYNKVCTNASCIHPQTRHPLQLLQNTTASEFTPKYWSGKVVVSKSGLCMEWEWKKGDGKLVPVLTNLLPAPDELLKMIRCNCHSDCSSMKCTCW